MRPDPRMLSFPDTCTPRGGSFLLCSRMLHVSFSTGTKLMDPDTPISFVPFIVLPCGTALGGDYFGERRRNRANRLVWRHCRTPRRLRGCHCNGSSGSVRGRAFAAVSGQRGTPSPSVTPTNLLYNIVATPGALWRYWRQGQRGGSVIRPLLLGTVPAVVAGSVIRVELLPGPRPFELVVALVLMPMCGWLLLGHDRAPSVKPTQLSGPVLVALVGSVGCVGGVYGIGGGSIIAPILLSTVGRPPKSPPQRSHQRSSLPSWASVPSRCSPPNNTAPSARIG